MSAGSDRRSTTYSPDQLRPLIAPLSVAVVGVSSRVDSFGSRAALNLAASDWPGSLIAVNPKYDEIHGIRCVPTVAELPEPVDCMIVAVGSADVPVVVKDALASARVRSILIFSSGLGETGADGFRVERELGALAAEHGVPISGPNTAGVFNFVDQVALSFIRHMDSGTARVGPVALVSQSTGIGVGLAHARERGVGVAYSLNAGNSCDVDVLDYVAFALADDAVQTVVLSFEGLREPRLLFDIGALAAERGKRVVVFKTGRSRAASAAVLSHTGSVAGDYALYRALFEQAGLIAVDSMEELIETARLCCLWPADGVRGVGVLTNSGGTAIMSADYAEEFSVELPALSPSTVEALRPYAPDFASVANPADLSANRGAWETLTDAIRVFGDDPNLDLVVLPIPAPDLGEQALQRPQAIVKAAEIANVALCPVWMSEFYQGPGSELLDQHPRLAMFRSLRRCMQAIDRIRRQAPAVGRAAPSTGEAAGEAIRAAVDAAVAALETPATGAVTLDEAASRKILAAAGLPVVRAELATTAEQAAAVAGEIGFPVVVKGVLRGINHKSDLGAVVLNLSDESAVRTACERIREAVTAASETAELTGFIVSAMESGGFEAFVGGRRDSLFGDVVVGGAGGTAMETVNDVQVGVVPLAAGRSAEMIGRLRCAPMLAAGRGTQGYDTHAFAAAVDAVGALLTADARIVDIDVNPLLLRRGTAGAVALDASVSLLLDGSDSGDEGGVLHA